MKRIIGAFDSTKDISSKINDNTIIKDFNVLHDAETELFNINNNKIFFYGNIYNKAELEEKYKLLTDSNAELVLKLYLDFNFNSIKELNGEFTFVIITHLETIICRDRHGCSLPIFYTEKFFSTSLSYLINNFKISKEINIDAIATFLGLGYIPTPLTPLKYIKKLGAGSFLLYKHGVSVTESNLYDFEDFTKNNVLNSSDLKISFNELLEKSLKIREENNNNISFLDFHNILNNSNFNSIRSNLTSEYNKNHNIRHHEINNLPKIIKCFELPFNDYNSIHNYLFIEKLKKNNSELLLDLSGINFLLGSNAINITKYFKQKKNHTLGLIKLLKRIINIHKLDKYKRIYLLKIIINRILNIYSLGRNGFTKKQIKALLKTEYKSATYKYQNSLPINSYSIENAYLTHNYFIDIKQSLNQIETYQMSSFAENFNLKLSYPLLDNNIYNFFKSLPIEIKIDNSGLRENNTFVNKNKNIDIQLHINLTNYLYDINLRKKLYAYMLNSDISKKLFNNSFLEKFFNNFEKEFISKNHINKVLYDLSFQFFNLLIINLWWDIYLINKKGNTLQDFY